MPTYEFCYCREQRVYFEIETSTQEEAEEEANERIQTFDLDSKDDESDDPGELELRGVLD